MRILIALPLLAVCSSLRVIDRPGQTIEKEFHTDSGPVTLIVGKKSGRAVNFDELKPFEVTSKLLTVKDDQKESNRRGRQMQTVTTDEEEIPVIEGVREPDDPAETRVFRNARIINNVLVTDEDNDWNQISDRKDEQEEPVSLHREGRILTGPIEAEGQKEFSVSSVNYQYPEYYYKHYYDPDRTGVAGPSPFETSANNRDQQIVTYSYSTSGGEIQGKPSKDVIYGSGFAAHPLKNPKSSSLSSASHNFRSSSNPSSEKFKPSFTWSGFSPSSSLIHPQNAFQNKERKTISASSSKIKFPSPGSVSLPLSSTSFLGSTSSSGVRPISNNIGHNIPLRQLQRDETKFPAWPSQDERFQRHQQNVQIFSTSQLNSSPLHTNKIRRHQQASGIPTPHQAFGDAGSMIHPGIVPANSQNFVIEDATFQSHPGAPAFSVPVPRLRPGSQFNDYAVQPHIQQDQSFYSHPNHYPGYPYYQYDDYDEFDSRPLIDKMMDPLRRVGEKVREFASPVIDPVIHAGQRFGNRLRIPERMDKIASGTVDTDAIPLVGGAVAVATLGALGAYAASKYSLDDLRSFLPSAATRSSKPNANISNILLKLADDLENEDPAFLGRLASSTSWLESSCAQRIFCTLVTSSIKEEEDKLEKENVRSESEGALEGNDGQEDEKPKSREARHFLQKEINYIENQINTLIDGIRGSPNENKNNVLRNAARNVVNAVKQRNCRVFSCSNKN